MIAGDFLDGVDNTEYDGIFVDYEDYTYPNHVSSTSLGNVFNGAIRVGFLFD